MTTPASQLAWVERLATSPQQPAPESCSVALDEAAAIARAIARSAEIAALRGEARWLEASVEASQARPPQLRMNGLRLDEVADARPRFSIGLRVPFAKPGTLAAGADALAQEALAVRARAEEEARQVTLDVRLALARHHGWLALAAVAVAERTLAEAEAKRLEQGVAAKQAQSTELAKAELELLEADGNVARAQGEAARWRAVVAAKVGSCTLAAESVHAWASATERHVDERDALVSAALSERPSVKRYAALSGLAASRLWTARAAAWPWFDWAQVGYEVTDLYAPDTWVFSLAIDIPVANWDGAHVHAAEAEQRAVLEAARREVESIVAEVDAGLGEWHACEAGLETLTRLRAGFDDARFAAIERASLEGRADPRDVFAIRRDLTRIERRRIEALIALREARARLLAVVSR